MAKKKPGIYDKVLPGLPIAPPQDIKYQEKVDKVKRELHGSATELVARYIDARERDADIKKLEYENNIRLEALTQLLAESEDRGDAGWGDYGANDNALRMLDGSQVRVQPEPYMQVKNKEDFRLWCIANGYEKQLQLWPSTANAVGKERLVAGQDIPDGCEMFRRNKIVYTPAGVHEVK